MRVLLPAERAHDLDRHAWDAVWQDRESVLLWLRIKDLHAWHRDNTRLDALLAEHLGCVNAECDLRASGNEGECCALLLEQDVATLDGVLNG